MNRLVSRLAVLLIALLAAACSEGPIVPYTAKPSFAISDAVHDGGNRHFFWLPPMVGSPGIFNGAFDASLSPVVSICNLADCATNVIAEFTTTSGPGSETVRVVPEEEHYIVNWHTKDLGLEEASTYRIRVLVAGTELAFADVDVVTGGALLKHVDTGEYVALKDGRTLPIVFRIEEGAVFVVDGSGGSSTLAGGRVSVDVPAGALSTTIGIVAEPARDEPVAEMGLIPGTVFDLSPDGTAFSVPARLGIRYDEGSLGDISEDELTLLKKVDGVWLEAENPVVDPAADLVTASVDGFSRWALGCRISTIDVSPATATLAPGETVQLSAVRLCEGVSDPIEARGTVWTSSDAAIASVDPRFGLVTALDEGVATVEAQIHLVCTLQFPNPACRSARITPGSAEITVEDPDAGPFSYCLTEALAGCIVHPAVSIENTVFDDLADGIEGNGIGSWSVQIRYTGRASFVGGVPLFLDVTAGVFLPSLSGRFNLTSTLRFLPFVDLLEPDGSYDVVGPLQELGGLFPETDVLSTEFVMIRSSTDPDLIEVDGCLTGLGGGSEFPLCVRIEGEPLHLGLSYATAGNTTLIAGGFTVPADPHVLDAANLLEGLPGRTVVAGQQTTRDGASVVLDGAGGFAYYPRPGDRGPDSFGFLLEGGGGGTVTVDLDGMVWYARNSQGRGAGTGTSGDPFGDLADAVPPSLPGDVIFVYRGDGTDVGYDASVLLKDDQQLIGEGAGLSLPTFGTIVQAGSVPAITSTTGASVRLANRNTVAGLAIRDPAGPGIVGANVVDLVVDRVEVSDAAGVGMSLTNVTGTASFTDVRVLGSGNFNNMRLSNAGGTIDLTVLGSTFENFATGTETNGLNVFLNGSARGTLAIRSSAFRNNRTPLLVAASGQASLDAVVSANVFVGNEFGASIANFQDGVLSYDISDNTFSGGGITTQGLVGASGNASHSGRITNNDITGPILGQAIGGSFGGVGSATVFVGNNRISAADNIGLFQGGNGATDDFRLDVTIEDNTVALSTGALVRGLQVVSLFNNTVCANIQGNSITVPGSGIEFRQADTSTMLLERLNGGTGSVTDAAVVAGHISDENNGVAVSAAVSTAVSGVPGGTCRVP